MNKELIASLQDEFKFRHAHCWNIIYRFSSAILVLYTIPYLYPDKLLKLEKYLCLFPIIGLFIALMGGLLLSLEYKLLSDVEEAFNKGKIAISEGSYKVNTKAHKRIGYFIISVWALSSFFIGTLEFYIIYKKG